MDNLLKSMTTDDLIFYGTILWGIGVLVILYIVSKRRGKGFIDAALESGFLSTPHITYDVHAAVKRFRLFRERAMFDLGPVVQIIRNGLRVSIFNTALYWRLSNSSSRVTIAHVRMHAQKLPEFILHSAIISLKHLGADGLTRGLNFDGHPEFSKYYVLQGDSEERIRVLFTPRLIIFFERKRKKFLKYGIKLGPISLGARIPCLEARGNEILFFFETKVVAPKKISEFVGETVEIVQALTSE